MEQLNNEDVQKLNTFGWSPKPNAPVAIRVVSNDGLGPHPNLRIEGIFYDTKDATAIRQLAIKITPLVEKLGFVARYYVDHQEVYCECDIPEEYLCKVVAQLVPYQRDMEARRYSEN